MQTLWIMQVGRWTLPAVHVRIHGRARSEYQYARLAAGQFRLIDRGASDMQTGHANQYQGYCDSLHWFLALHSFSYCDCLMSSNRAGRTHGARKMRAGHRRRRITRVDDVYCGRRREELFRQKKSRTARLTVVAFANCLIEILSANDHRARPGRRMRETLSGFLRILTVDIRDIRAPCTYPAGPCGPAGCMMIRRITDSGRRAGDSTRPRSR